MKKKLLKSMIAMLLALVMVLSGLPTFGSSKAKAAPLSEGQSFMWDYDDWTDDKRFCFMVLPNIPATCRVYISSKVKATYPELLQSKGLKKTIEILTSKKF